MQAAQIPELKAFLKVPPGTRNALQGAGTSGRSAAGPDKKSAFTGLKTLAGKHKAIVIALLLLTTLAVGAGVYYVPRQKALAKKEKEAQLRRIYEQEVQKAAREIRAYRLEKQEAQKKAQAQQEEIRRQAAALQSLKMQLNTIMTRHKHALWALEEIERPRLFRSRAKKEAEMAAQLRLIESLEQKAVAIRAKMAGSKAGPDLSADLDGK